MTSARGESFTSDDEGQELASLDDAERMSAEATVEIGRDRLPKEDAREVTIELRNEHRQRVLTVTVSIEIHRVNPQPLPPHE